MTVAWQGGAGPGGRRACGVRSLAVAVVVLLAGGCGPSPRQPLPAGQAPVSPPRLRPNLRAGSLALVTYVQVRYPWRYEDLDAWAVSADALAGDFRRLLGVAEEGIVQQRDLRPDDLRQFLARLPERLPPKADVVLYVAIHQERDGRVVFGDGSQRPAADLLSWVQAIPRLRLFVLDACFAEVAERGVRWPPGVARWYSADAAHAALAFGPGLGGQAVAQFFGDARGGSVFVRLWEQALAEGLAAGGATVAEPELFGRIEAGRERLRRAARLTRLPAFGRGVADGEPLVLFAAADTEANDPPADSPAAGHPAPHGR